MNTTGRKCKYCGTHLKAECVPKIGVCFYCDNESCAVKPMTDYAPASSDKFKTDLKGITNDWEGL